jgi:ElaB/YqjD/DUF883 family membrane-anchored ribosome-binding protein
MPEEPTVHDLREQLNSIKHEATLERAEASAIISETIDRVAATAEDASQKVNDTYQSAAEIIRAHPFAAILGAAAVGLILGRVWR